MWTKWVALRLVPSLLFVMSGMTYSSLNIGEMMNSDVVVYMGPSFNQSYDGELRLLDVATGKDVLLIPDTQDDPIFVDNPVIYIHSQPIWSPDGTELIFRGSVMTAEGTVTSIQSYHIESGQINSHSLSDTHDPVNVLQLTGSPNERYWGYEYAIRYELHGQNVSRYALYVFDTHTNESIEVAESLPDRYSRPVWSPDGIHFAYIARYFSFIGYLAGRELRVFNVLTGSSQTITTSSSDTYLLHPRWDATSQNLYFVEHSPGLKAKMLNIESGITSTILTANGEPSQMAIPAPNSSKLALLTEDFDESGQAISVVSVLDGSTETILYTHYEEIGQIRNILWSPSGNYLLLQAGTILIIDATTGEEIRRVEGQQPAWRP